MTLEERVQQLDMYSGATGFMRSHTGDTHPAATAVFLPVKAHALWGNFGVGSIHALNPAPEQANSIQKWVISHNRLEIPALFIVEGLHGFDTGAVFSAPIGLAATWNPLIAQQVALGNQWKARCGPETPFLQKTRVKEDACR